MWTRFRYEIFYGRESNAIAREFFGDTLPDLQELAYNTSLVLVNSHFSINEARPMVPNFVEIGGIHIDDLQTLPKVYIQTKQATNSTFFQHLEKILNESTCAVLLSMGSMLQTETFDVQKLREIFAAFQELPCTILFKGDVEVISKKIKIPNNVYIESWIPQQEILCAYITKSKMNRRKKKMR